ncbi:unnamed protein product (macronuclear) [Paramecium tetraurelia]|uniref:Anaphase-promoting complex subunit 4-like WD40 domain-containing protein n=1 Tax=Paramecium tetraurelia TaxID=5888 RepID=A0CZA4_PARTE|nr:uncharacterized protein GSPATT00011694001 [Paramecium tetraurelia]CAK76121.1 unnamed protein product [Paramecium tetraurelia]|eukprot:XP_001443518.1 hypothetical protein (macronuclear) [Paramecium tetraurelia strain d4-2]
MKIIPFSNKYTNFVNDKDKVICFSKQSQQCSLYNLTLSKIIRKFNLKKQPKLMQIIDNNKLLIGEQNGDIQIIDISTAKLITNLSNHAYQVVQIIPFEDQYMITMCQNKEARIWDSKNLKQIFKINHQTAVKQIYFSKNGQKVILVAYDCSVKIFSTQTGEIINQINHNIQQVYYIKYFQQFDQCLIAYQNKQDRQVLLWDIQEFTNKQILQGFNNRIQDVYFNSKSKKILISKDLDLAVIPSNSNKLIIYNILSEEIRAEIKGLAHQNKINVEFTKNNHLIIDDQQHILVYTENGKFNQTLFTFNENQIKYLQIIANQSRNNNRQSIQMNDQKITQDDETNQSQIWLHTPSYLAPIS